MELFLEINLFPCIYLVYSFFDHFYIDKLLLLLLVYSEVDSNNFLWAIYQVNFALESFVSSVIIWFSKSEKQKVCRVHFSFSGSVAVRHFNCVTGPIIIVILSSIDSQNKKMILSTWAKEKKNHWTFFPGDFLFQRWRNLDFWEKIFDSKILIVIFSAVDSNILFLFFRTTNICFFR